MGCVQSNIQYHHILEDSCCLQQYGHCCKVNCFAYKSSQRAVLSEHDLPCCVLDIIMNYLPDQMRNNTPIIHGHNRYNNRIMYSPSLCPIWSNHTKEKTNNNVKIVVLGDRCVGKTSLIKRYTAHTYSEEYHDPTVCEYEAQMLLMDGHYTLNISDSISQRRTHVNFQFDHEETLRSGQIFICCFSVDSEASYQYILDTRTQILHCKEDDNNWAIIWVATKCDLIRGASDIEFVDTHQVMKRAKDWNIGYIETSAKDDVNIDSLFERSIYEFWAQSESHMPYA